MMYRFVGLNGSTDTINKVGRVYDMIECVFPFKTFSVGDTYQIRRITETRSAYIITTPLTRGSTDIGIIKMMTRPHQEIVNSGHRIINTFDN